MRKVRFTDYVDRRREDSIEIELPDGSTVIVPPGELWPDAAHDALAAGDMAETTRLVLGDDHDRFVAAGGNWRILSGILQDVRGTDPGESAASSA
jgi:hypothetical protein